MNERIKQLTGKALDQTMPQTWYGISPDDLDRIAAKLAELIVRECIEQLNISNVPAPISAGLNLGRVAIKEHFGV